MLELLELLELVELEELVELTAISKPDPEKMLPLPKPTIKPPLPLVLPYCVVVVVVVCWFESPKDIGGSGGSTRGGRVKLGMIGKPFASNPFDIELD